MKAYVSSLKREFVSYELDNVVSVQYVGRDLILTTMECGSPSTHHYNSNEVIVNIIQ